MFLSNLESRRRSRGTSQRLGVQDPGQWGGGGGQRRFEDHRWCWRLPHTRRLHTQAGVTLNLMGNQQASWSSCFQSIFPTLLSTAARVLGSRPQTETLTYFPGREPGFGVEDGSRFAGLGWERLHHLPWGASRSPRKRQAVGR